MLKTTVRLNRFGKVVRVLESPWFYPHETVATLFSALYASAFSLFSYHCMQFSVNPRLAALPFFCDFVSFLQPFLPSLTEWRRYCVARRPSRCVCVCHIISFGDVVYIGWETLTAADDADVLFFNDVCYKHCISGSSPPGRNSVELTAACSAVSCFIRGLFAESATLCI